MPINDPWQYFLDREKQKEAERQKYGRVITPERPNLWEAPIGNDLPPEGGITGNQPRSPATFFPDAAPNQQQQSNQGRPNLSGYPEDPYAGDVSQSEDRLQSLSNPYSPNFIPIVNQDHGWKGRMKDILRESLYNFSQEWRANAGMPGDQRLAAAGGAALGGGLAGGFDPTLNEQRDRLRDIGWERARLGDLQNSALRTAQTQTIYRDDQRAEEELKRKQQVDRNRANYWDGVLKNRQDKLDLSHDQLDDLKGYRKFLIENGTRQTDARLKQIDEVIRHNEAEEAQQAKNEQGRNTRSDLRNQSQTQRKQLEIDARKALAEYNAAQASGRLQDAAAAKERLIELKAKYDGVNETPEK